MSNTTSSRRASDGLLGLSVPEVDQTPPKKLQPIGPACTGPAAVEMVHKSLTERLASFGTPNPAGAALETMRQMAGCVERYPHEDEVEAFALTWQMKQSLQRDPSRGNVKRLASLHNIPRRDVAKTMRNGDEIRRRPCRAVILSRSPRRWPSIVV